MPDEYREFDRALNRALKLAGLGCLFVSVGVVLFLMVTCAVLIVGTTGTK